MNLNILAYIIYLLITIVIIIYVGRVCYTNGGVFIQNLLKQDTALANQVNKSLLLGYYLLNIGYCSITIISWNTIETSLNLIEVLSIKVAFIILIIAVMHYINIIVLGIVHK